ncbi:MAG: hypothetical protein MHPSP_003243, partial [Paramarteilia canceri]
LRLTDLKQETAEVYPFETARDPRRLCTDVDENILSKFHLSIKPSSISFERDFLFCSRINVPIRGRMSDEALSNILFMHENP